MNTKEIKPNNDNTINTNAINKDKSIDKLEFNIIKEKMHEYAHSNTVLDLIDRLEPIMVEEELIKRINETTAARKVIDSMGLPPLPYPSKVVEVIELCNKGELPTPEQLMAVCQFANSCSRLIKYLLKCQSLDFRISSFGRSLNELDELQSEIGKSIRNDKVDSNASNELDKLRKLIEKNETDVKLKAENILQKNSKWFSENYVSVKNGHYVLPVLKKHRSQFSGSVIEVSRSGGTYFMEPSSVGKLQNQLEELRIKEEDEVRRILYTLSALVCEYEYEINSNIDMVNQLDFIFAKGRLSQAMDGTEPTVTTGRQINIEKGRHPLLNKEKCVPIDFSINEGESGVIITGPNTGGKTVSLKTVGLLSIMAQSGLHIPAKEGSIIAMHSSYMCDVGDNQSISENLSTFSAHITNVIDILNKVDSQSLVIIDELCSGTDPAEGMGLAIAIIEELRYKECIFVVSTHYPQVKDYSQNTDGIVSARMAFDRDTLTPLYKLEMGETGNSCALHIAKKLGLKNHILDNAQSLTYSQLPSTESNIIVGKKLNENNNKNKQKTNTGSHVGSNNKIVPAQKEKEGEKPYIFKIGDSVKIHPDGQLGIVYKPNDSRGDVCVQIKGEKLMFNHKRISLHIAAENLYPDDYDMSIIFDSVKNRKAKNKLDKGNPTGVIEFE